MRNKLNSWSVSTACAVLLLGSGTVAQETLTVNGITDDRPNAYALTNGRIYQSNGNYIDSGTLLIRQGRIVDVDDGRQVPDGYFEIDLAGKHVYPGLIDIYSQYGVPERRQDDDSQPGENILPGDGALNVNDAIRSHYRAAGEFSPQEEQRESFRKLGFSTVLSLRADGIARGTSALITLGNETANESIIVADAAAHYSLDKGTSIQLMPVSLMGSFALLRQTYLDAQWYGNHQPRPFTDLSLEALLQSGDLPQIMEVDNWQLALTADRIGDEFDVQYVLKTSGDSYKRADLMRDTDAALIIPVDFPEAPSVDDILEADAVEFAELKHWELAPYNPRVLADAGITFAITSGDADADFWTNLRKAVAGGLAEETAIAALTTVPAGILGVDDQLGELAPGQIANFLVTNGELLHSDTLLLENWIHGQRYNLIESHDERSGNYELRIGDQNLTLVLDIADGNPHAQVSFDQGDDRRANVELNNDLIALNFVFDDAGNRIRLNGWTETNGWRGNGRTSNGELVSWQLTRQGADDSAAPDTEEDAGATDLPSPVLYPFAAYGRESLPEQQDLLIRNATVWTNEDMGTLITDVLVRDGLIEAVGDDLSARNVTVIDGSGKHLTPGIVDEHSHIALFNINEVMTNSSMVRMKDVVNSENINIYRNLAGGVTVAQLLHGSANPIGGQSAIIKMRWGASPQELLIEGADEFIKFALGENVKRSTNPASTRYPQTRMGVEQVFVNAFSQAQEYDKAWDEWNNMSSSARRNTPQPRRDLVDEAMLAVLNGELYVTSHSYVQSEINMLMHVADSFDFNINTFTHILEGYKVADKMAAHGAGGSTFSDWWGYKWEVRYAIPYNAALMQQAGVVVAINSDSAEMSRRLNQEAAKTIKYGGLSENDALKLVTLNPAKLLHLDDRIGSIREGKDADLVLWSDHPLSVYAVAETTWIEGRPYFDRELDLLMREQVEQERARIIADIVRDESVADNNAESEDGA